MTLVTSPNVLASRHFRSTFSQRISAGLVALFFTATGFAQALPADGFRYPVGAAVPGRVSEAQDEIDGWFNQQDFAQPSADGSLHPGEDWRRNAAASLIESAGESVYSIANGEIIDVVARSNGTEALVVRHFVPLNAVANAQPSLRISGTTELFSVYVNIEVDDDVLGAQGFTGEPIAIARGQRVGAIAQLSVDSHLHFEIRTLEPQNMALYASANDAERYSGVTTLDQDGLTLDPSDFIDGARTLELTAGPMLYVHDSAANLALVDVLSGQLSIIANMGVVMTDIAFSTSGELYGLSQSNLYKISLVTGQPTLLGSHNILGGNALVFAADNTLYAAGGFSNDLFVLNAETGASTSVGTMGFSSAGDLAFFDGQLYLASTTDELVAVDLDNSAVGTAIGDLGFSEVFGLAVASDGNIYGSTGTKTILIDVATGTAEEIADYANQGFSASFGSSFFVESGANSNAASLVSAVLPNSRSVQTDSDASVFLTAINTSTNTAENCALGPRTTFAGDFSYQATDPLTNAPIGTVNTPTDVAAGAAQSFIVVLRPTAELELTEFQFNVGCENSELSPTTSGISTLLLSASADPVPDLVALVATATGDGVLRINPQTNTGAFAVAAVNVGTGDSIRVSVDTGVANLLPLSFSLCETDSSAACINPTVPASVVTRTINNGETPTFSVFVTASDSFAFRPDLNRIFLRFSDLDGNIIGSTSVAVAIDSQ